MSNEHNNQATRARTNSTGSVVYDVSEGGEQLDTSASTSLSERRRSSVTFSDIVSIRETYSREEYDRTPTPVNHNNTDDKDEEEKKVSTQVEGASSSIALTSKKKPSRHRRETSFGGGTFTDEDIQKHFGHLKEGGEDKVKGQGRS